MSALELAASVHEVAPDLPILLAAAWADEIGADTLISMYTRILSSNHTIPGPETAIRALPDVCQPTHIGCDVWIGTQEQTLCQRRVAEMTGLPPDRIAGALARLVGRQV